MKVKTDAVLVLRWRRPVCRSMCERRRQGRRDHQ